MIGHSKYKEDYDYMESMGIGIGHKDDIPEDTFEGLGIGIGHREDKDAKEEPDMV